MDLYALIIAIFAVALAAPRFVHWILLLIRDKPRIRARVPGDLILWREGKELCIPFDASVRRKAINISDALVHDTLGLEIDYRVRLCTLAREPVKNILIGGRRGSPGCCVVLEPSPGTTISRSTFGTLKIALRTEYGYLPSFGPFDVALMKVEDAGVGVAKAASGSTQAKLKELEGLIEAMDGRIDRLQDRVARLVLPVE